MKKTIAYLLALAVLITAFAGCSGGPASSPVSSGTSASNGTAASSGAPADNASAEAVFSDGTFALTKEQLQKIQPSGFPKKPITYISPYTAGGASDLVARALAKAAKDIYGVDMVVENVEGGSGSVGVMQCLTSNPDGYTVSILNSALIGMIQQGRIDINWQEDMTILCKEVEDVLGIFVKKGGDCDTFDKFLAKVKNNPAGTVNMGLAGTLTANHACVLSLGEALGDKEIFNIPIYGGAARSITEIIGGHCDATVCKPADCINQLNSGEVTCIAYFAKERVPTFPDVPTIQELVPEAYPWGDPSYAATYLITTKGVDRQIADWLSQLFIGCILSDEFQALAEKSGFLATNLPWGEAATQSVSEFYDSLAEMSKIFDDVPTA